MLLCIQTFIFLSLLTKQYFFILILFIIYLGAIAVLFLFVVLVIGNSIFENNKLKNNFDYSS
jgi:NADH:ubiquinone oxidoreductase subunit 6 (subunit J)